MTRDVDEADGRVPEVEVRETEVDRDPAQLLFLQSVRVDPGQRAHERALAVVDVSGGSRNYMVHGELFPGAASAVPTCSG